MQISDWLPLSQLSLYPPSQIGVWGKLLATLHQAHVPLPPSLVIPSQTFKLIADENRLTDRLSNLRLKLRQAPAEELQSAVAQVFSEIKVSRELSNQLLAGFHSVVKGSLARLVISSDQTRHGYLTDSLIKGDANTFQAMFELWGQLYLKTQQLYPAALAIQRQQQPSASGYILTKDPEAGTSQMGLYATWGAEPLDRSHHQAYDHFKIDTRTGHLTFSQVVPKAFQLIRYPDALKSVNLPRRQQDQPALTIELAQRIAEHARHFKLLHLAHAQLHWEVVDGQLYFTAMQLMEELAHPVTPRLTTGKTLLTGTPVRPGIVKGTCVMDSTITKVNSLPPGSILVVSTLTPALKPYLKQLTGLISEKPLPVFAQTLVNHLHLPTITLARGATQRLKSGQPITLNATHGVVLSAPSKDHSAPAFTKTKVMVSVSNPVRATETLTPAVDGAFFKSDFTFFQQGRHPLAIIRSGDRQQLVNVLAERIRAFKPRPHFPLLYRPLDLLSSDLLQLPYAHSYEKPEPNPLLGYHGAIRHLHTLELFDTELEALTQAGQYFSSGLGIVLPFARTPTELRLLLNHLRAQFSSSLTPFEIWWQLAVPSNLLLFNQFLSPQLTGIIVSTGQLHALIHGIDPENPDVAARYPLDVHLFRTIIKDLHAAAPHHQILVQLDQDQPDLVQLVVELGLAGVIVKPYHADRTKHLITELEGAKLHQIEI